MELLPPPPQFYGGANPPPPPPPCPPPKKNKPKNVQRDFNHVNVASVTLVRMPPDLPPPACLAHSALVCCSPPPPPNFYFIPTPLVTSHSFIYLLILPIAYIGMRNGLCPCLLVARLYTIN